ncbi:PASTA domain-containing protein [Pseudonocardia sp. C8]|uniref:PASTA domain-containing protein n=1 Tax=Pseudonocardia sp. C8 TaxID=2762759 RepID=UPI0016433727|nr:PASTA domain-containing protein [Pseudonocardia sp. C8]MBC3192312.1 PASTA domain-containing protein [Pseudonocardia sp. C8]
MSGNGSSPGRQRVVTVPPLTGLDVTQAHDTALDGGVLAVEHSSCGAEPERRVLRQEPRPGAVVPYGSAVDVWTGPPPDDGNGGGGGGVLPVHPGPVLSGRG